MTTHPNKKIVGIAGSLRRASSSRALLKAAVSLVPDDVELEVFELADVPLYNLDLEPSEGPPKSVAALRAAIAAADAVLIVSPEYNHGISGVLKNALDWASRPAFRSPLLNKKVAVVGVSGNGMGGPRGVAQVEQALRATVSELFPYRELLVGRAHAAFRDGELDDEDVRRRLTRYLAALGDWLHTR
jgi:chromate reductase